MNCIYKISLLLFFIISCNNASSQEPATIKVRKEQNLVKAYFDNTELKIMPVDRFGNPKENKIVSYKLYIKGKEVTSFSGFSNNLSHDMVIELKKQKKSTKIFFTEIKAEDDEGHIISLPDVIEVWFPDCKNCDPKRKKN